MIRSYSKTLESFFRRRFFPSAVRTPVWSLLVVVVGAYCSGAVARVAQAEPPPNFVIIFTDDQGYGDLGCFGSSKIKTPCIDRLAAEGRRMTSFMVASPVCTPSRAALLTGCYPKRVGLHQHVLFPNSTKGLHPGETTLADLLKGRGYATACFGKWHLGHHRETLPMRHGFDAYLGIPYSNDMNHPDNQRKPRVSSDELWADPASTLTHWNTPLVQGEEIVEVPVDQRTITRRYTDAAIEFITENREQPFFVYLPHSMPHIPLYVPDEVRDPNPKNAYTCVIEHIDTEVGRLVDTVRRLGLDRNTYVIYTSDNGPWLRFKHHGGSAGPLRDGKGTTFEGGQRVPCVIWGPGRIPAGTTCDRLTGTIDVLPTVAALTGADLPANKIDGIDASGLWSGKAEGSLRREFLYYTSRGEIEGIRQDDWKLLLKASRPRKMKDQRREPGDSVVRPMLFDLSNDLGERDNVAAINPEVVDRLTARLKELDQEVTLNARDPWIKPR